MSGRSLGTASACPWYGAVPYQAPSCTLSALICNQSASEGPNSALIGSQTSWLARIAVTTTAHPTGVARDPNRRGAHQSATIARMMAANTYGNANTRVIGIHQTQLARYDVNPSMPATKTQYPKPKVRSM